MQAQQKMVGENGLENFLFPMPYLYLTQGEHNGYNIDIVGWSANGQVSNTPLYAPFTCKCVYVGNYPSENTPTVCWQSIDKVNFIDGSVDYACISLSHDDNFNSYSVGDIKQQGEIFGHTGTTGITSGDHCHLGIGKGEYRGYGNVGGGYQLVNYYHTYLGMGVNDTEVVRPIYTWESFIPYAPPKIDKSWIPLAIVNVMRGNL